MIEEGGGGKDQNGSKERRRVKSNEGHIRCVIIISSRRSECNSGLNCTGPRAVEYFLRLEQETRKL